MEEKKSINKRAWTWIPSLYFAEGIPYVIVMTVSVIMYKRFEISNTEIALYTSWLYLPWVIKPFWSPLVDILRTKRWWIVVTQILIGASFAGAAFVIPMDSFFQYTSAFFWLLAFSSATHDISADGFYMIGLNEGEQSFFVGIRSTFYRIAMIMGQGILIILAGYFEKSIGIKTAWVIVFVILAVLFFFFSFYHQMILPRPENSSEYDKPLKKGILKDFFKSFIDFFTKKKILVTIAFLLLYRLGEGQLVKLASPFMLDPIDKGGLGLSTSDVGYIYGTIGIIALIAGGILGGFLASLKGLKHWLWWMLIAINLPNLVYVYLSLFQPQSFILISTFVAVEQFGYGFGFTAYLLYMIFVSQGEYKASHYAICTGFMALGMMIPGMFSGWLQEEIGYQLFFVWVVVATIPAFIITKFIPLDEEFGKKNKT